MKFARKLQSELTEEWKEQYLNYEELKTFIKNSHPNHDDNVDNQQNIEQINTDGFEKELISLIRAELVKINSFYLKSENKLKIELQLLISKQSEVYSPLLK